MKYFVLSDVHSFYDAMDAALKKNGFDVNNPNHIIIVCGDLFDRGPDAVKVFRFMEMMANENRLHYISGNHEDLFISCVMDIYYARPLGRHHFTNGTVDTISQFTGINQVDLVLGIFDKEEFKKSIQPLLNFITVNAIDFLSVKDYVFVHGWIPCNPNTGEVSDKWEEGNWREARWLNGMSAWKNGARLPGRTIVCGHWHCSWGWSHIRQQRNEFPQKNEINWLESFEPFVDEGIIAMDACTAYTNMCNCIVIDI